MQICSSSILQCTLLTWRQACLYSFLFLGQFQGQSSCGTFLPGRGQRLATDSHVSHFLYDARVPCHFDEGEKMEKNRCCRHESAESMAIFSASAEHPKSLEDAAIEHRSSSTLRLRRLLHPELRP